MAAGLWSPSANTGTKTRRAPGHSCSRLARSTSMADRRSYTCVMPSACSRAMPAGVALDGSEQRYRIPRRTVRPAAASPLPRRVAPDVAVVGYALHGHEGRRRQRHRCSAGGAVRPLAGELAGWLSACLPACLPVCLSTCLPVCLSACLSARVCQSVSLSVSVCQCQSVCGAGALLGEAQTEAPMYLRHVCMHLQTAQSLAQRARVYSTAAYSVSSTPYVDANTLRSG